MMLAAMAAAVAVLLVVLPRRRPTLADAVEGYILGESDPMPIRRIDRLEQAGLDWSKAEHRTRRFAAASLGAFSGLAVSSTMWAHDPLRVAGIAILGAATALVALSMWITAQIERRSRTLTSEVPIVAEAIALLTLGGESVASALQDVGAMIVGSIADDLGTITTRHDEGIALNEALDDVATRSVSSAATRLYRLLSNAHVSGGALADSLGELAKDVRTDALNRVTREGGIRSIASYGPILGLMVPVALLFMIYPTLRGLEALAGR